VWACRHLGRRVAKYLKQQQPEVFEQFKAIVESSSIDQ
jgi:hypothetical protein